MNRQDQKKHQQALKLLEKDVLTYDEKYFILENFHEAGSCNNRVNGAHFTPLGLANDFCLEIGYERVIDLCAGIGVLSFIYYHLYGHDTKPEITCIELNPHYVEVGKKILPEATWICGDVLDPALIETLGHFDMAYSNPPFGKSIKSPFSTPRYRGGEFEYKVMDVASDLADCGAFIIPQRSAPFRYSGAHCFQDLRNVRINDPVHYSGSALKKYTPFNKDTDINLEMGVGVDCDFHQDQWRDVSISVEIVNADFVDTREARKTPNFGLFAHTAA